tara:strand:+ start:53 stop:181 length:129 start_codon:yes stop_codon:yes gene_type:complete
VDDFSPQNVWAIISVEIGPKSQKVRIDWSLILLSHVGLKEKG